MHEIKIPQVAPLKFIAAHQPGEALVDRATTESPSGLYYFHIAGVKDEDVAKVLRALVERRLIERARKVSENGKSLAPAAFIPVLIFVVAGLIVGGLVGLLAATAFHASSPVAVMSVRNGALVGALLGFFYGLWRRAKKAAAYGGLKLLCGESAERLHPDYWLPYATRVLCSPKTGILLEP